MQINAHHMKICWLTVIFFLFGCHSKPVNKALLGLQNLPSFTILSLDSSQILKSETIPSGKSIVLFLFEPSCSHCQRLTDAILKNESRLQKIRFYFVSNADPKDIDTFTRNRRLDQMDNIYVGRDFQFSFFRAFTPSSIPYVAIYNSDKLLSKIFNGEADIDSLINYAQN
jgi:hypothetical protein